LSGTSVAWAVSVMVDLSVWGVQVAARSDCLLALEM
jgi:hypothetical protein